MGPRYYVSNPYFDSNEDYQPGFFDRQFRSFPRNSVSNYAQGSTKYEGFPIKVNVPKDAILLGCKGSAKGDDIQTLASESVDQGSLGIMVWYASVVDGLRFDPGWDVSSSEESIQAFQAAMTFLNPSIP